MITPKTFRLPDGSETDSAEWASAAWQEIASSRGALLKRVLESDKGDWCRWKHLLADIRKELRECDVS